MSSGFGGIFERIFLTCLLLNFIKIFAAICNYVWDIIGELSTVFSHQNNYL